MRFQERLIDMEACSEAVDWVDGHGLKKAYDTCERADWMLWLAGRMADRPGWPTKQEVVLAACDCAELALRHVPKGEDRPRRAIETARAWARGKASLDDVRAARAAAEAARAAAWAAAEAAEAAAEAAGAAEHKKMCALIRKRLKCPTTWPKE